MKLNKKLILILIVALGTTLFSCGNSNKDGQKEKVRILYPNWIEAVAYSHLSKIALEEQGYEVELTNLEPGLIYGELSKEHLVVQPWLPVLKRQQKTEIGL